MKKTITKYITLTADNHIGVIADKPAADDSLMPVEFPKDFDFSLPNLIHYMLIGGELVRDKIKYIALTKDGHISKVSDSPAEDGSLIPFEFPDDFNFSQIADYTLIDGIALAHDRIKYIALTDDNRIGMVSDFPSEDGLLMQFEFPAGFDFSRYIEYKVISGELVHDPKPAPEPQPDYYAMMAGLMEGYYNG